jgi:hypothetical protein
MAKDFLDREIKAGCTVVYPCRRKSRMWLKTLKVIQVENDQLTGYDSFGYSIHIKNVQNCVVVEPKVPTMKEQQVAAKFKDAFYAKLYGG